MALYAQFLFAVEIEHKFVFSSMHPVTGRAISWLVSPRIYRFFPERMRYAVFSFMATHTDINPIAFEVKGHICGVRIMTMGTFSLLDSRTANAFLFLNGGLLTPIRVGMAGDAEPFLFLPDKAFILRGMRIMTGSAGLTSSGVNVYLR
jgi:hypothetical protein